MQTGQIVLVLLCGVEGHETNTLGHHQMPTLELIDGHFESLEVDAFDPHLQVPSHKNLAKFLLFGEVRRIDSIKAREPALEIGSSLRDVGE